MKQERYEFLKNHIQGLEIDLQKGKVMNRKEGLKPNGYKYIMFKYKNFYVHQIIAVAGGLNPIGQTINHIDGNKHNNSIENLEVVSRKENVQMSYGQGLQDNSVVQKGSKHWNAKLSEKEVLEIRDLLKTGMYQKDIAKMYGVTRSMISMINTKSWR